MQEQDVYLTIEISHGFAPHDKELTSDSYLWVEFYIQKWNLPKKESPKMVIQQKWENYLLYEENPEEWLAHDIADFVGDYLEEDPKIGSRYLIKPNVRLFFYNHLRHDYTRFSGDKFLWSFNKKCDTEEEALQKIRLYID